MDYEPPITAETLINDPDFRGWVRGERPDLETFWTNWIKQHPELHEQVEQARAWLIGLGVQHADLPEAQRQEAVDRIMNAVRMPRPLWYPWRWGAAASIAGLLCWGGYHLVWPPIQPPTDVASVTLNRPVSPAEPQLLVTTTTATRFIQLADGSAVFLKKGSTLRYPLRFTGTQRFVYLDGEAFFEVAKDAKHPFVVQTNGLTAKVVGTSFSIRSGRETVTVAVRTGRVAVVAMATGSPSRQAAKPLLLTRNQRATYARTDETLTRSAATPTQPQTYPPLLVRQFDEVPVADVLDALQRTYGIPIHYDRNALRQCTLTAEFGDEPLSSKMRLICKAIEATYTTSEAGIQINSAGCQ